MLTTLFPKAAHRYISLPVFGPIIDDLARWFLEHGYALGTLRQSLRVVAFMAYFLSRHGIHRVEELAPSDLERCWKALQRSKPADAGRGRAIERFLRARGVLKTAPSPVLSASALQLAAYCEYLWGVRGLSPSTLPEHRCYITKFLAYLRLDKNPHALSMINARVLENFLKKAATHVSRGTLQHVVAVVRGYLRFLSTTGQTPPGLDTQIDTPRVYRLEQLPRSLPWSTVEAFLASILRTTPLGRRDYAMFYLIATYGLRSCEIVSLRLDDIDWRAKVIRIQQTKTRGMLELPLTASAGSVLIDYLRKVKRPEGYRELFLRMRAPIGILKPTAVTEAFQAWSRRSGLAIPFQGAHCLRHSYAVHLLRQGTQLKVIGDLMGHRSAESTAVYLRLSTEDLRDVGLAVPPSRTKPMEVEP